MKIQVGCNPLSWMNSDIPSLGSHIPVEQCVSEIALIGYRGVELEDGLREGLYLNPNLLSDRNLQLVAGWHGTELLHNEFNTEMQRLMVHMHYLQQHGGHVVNLAEVSRSIHRDPNSRLSDRPTLSESEWQHLALGLDRLSLFIRGQGMVPAYHHHMGTVVQSGRDIDMLMARTHHLGLLLDTGHLVYAGADPMQVLAKHGHRVVHVHAKNVRLSSLREKLIHAAPFTDAVLSGVFTVPGDNGPEDRDGIDFFPVIRGLTALNYSGWVIMEAEQDPSVAHPYSYAKLGYQTLQALLSQVQLYHGQRQAGLLEV